MKSQDYSALTFCILAFTRLIYPLEYVFPVIPLLPSCMPNSEQVVNNHNRTLMVMNIEYGVIEILKLRVIKYQSVFHLIATARTNTIYNWINFRLYYTEEIEKASK